VADAERGGFRGVIFDMDGTLTVPILDFDRIRNEIGLPPGRDLAAQIGELPDSEKRRAWGIVERHEAEAARDQTLQDGCRDLLVACRRIGMRLGIVTRNVHEHAASLCRRFDLDFDTILTREFGPMKPDPAPVLHLLEHWDLNAEQVLMVGDFVDDITCGQAAGVSTCYFENPGKPCEGGNPTWTVHSMGELRAILFGQCEELSV